MITEQEYFHAIKIVNEYTDQIKKQTVRALQKTGITKTPSEMNEDWDIYFPTIPVRLINILKNWFNDRRICDITKKEFLSTRTAGLKTWSELCYFTGNSEF